VEQTPRPVEKRPVTTQAVDSLREYLLSGAVAPCTRLTEVALSEQLGTARATVRMSLNQLAFEGIVTKIPYTGWQVADMTADAVWEIWTLRGCLESLAARLTADTLDEVKADAIARAHRNLLEACVEGELSTITASDFKLHRTIVELAGHRRLRTQYEMVEQQVRFCIATSNAFVADAGENIAAQHAPLIAALLAGDAREASQEAWSHNECEGRRLAEWFRQRSSGSVPIAPETKPGPDVLHAIEG
jgi:DNA-binding GntR family transcriptional regulator